MVDGRQIANDMHAMTGSMKNMNINIATMNQSMGAMRYDINNLIS